MTTFKRLRVVSVAAALAVVTLFATASPAQAHNISYCGHTYVWSWGGSGPYDDERIDFAYQYWYNGHHYHITKHYGWFWDYFAGGMRWGWTHDKKQVCWWHR